MQIPTYFQIEKSNFKHNFIFQAFDQHSPHNSRSPKLDLENVISMSCILYFQNIFQIHPLLTISILTTKVQTIIIATWAYALLFLTLRFQVKGDLQNEVFCDLHIQMQISYHEPFSSLLPWFIYFTKPFPLRIIYFIY